MPESVQALPLEQVDEPARRRHHDVGVTHPGDLRADGHAAVDRGDAHPDGTAQRHEDVGDLLREFPGRDEDQPAGCLLPARARRGRQPGQQRKAEGQRLARPGLGAAQHVAAGQRVGQRPGLDRERLVDVTRRERPDQPGVQAELGERGRGRRRSRGGGVQGTIKLGVRGGLRRPGGPRGPGPGRGCGDRKTRADAWTYAACGKLHHCSGAACSTDVNNHGDRRAARPRSGGEDCRLTAKAISRAGIPRSRCGWPRARRSGASR